MRGRGVRGWALYALLALAVPGGAACRTVRAETPVERPALEVPPPPPRVIIPLPAPDAQLRLEPVGELPVTSGDKSPTRPRPQTQKPDPAKPADPKTDPVEAPDPPPAQPPPIRLENPNAAQLATQVRETLGRAKAVIDRIDPNNLSEPRRKAYVDAKLFAQQADDEARKNNWVAAKELADKAERLASTIK